MSQKVEVKREHVWAPQAIFRIEFIYSSRPFEDVF